MPQRVEWNSEVEQWFPGFEHDRNDYDEPELPSTLDTLASVADANPASFLGVAYSHAGSC